MVREGHVAREIGERLGRPRNSVISRAFRQGLRVQPPRLPAAPKAEAAPKERRAVLAGSAAARMAEGIRRRREALRAEDIPASGRASSGASGQEESRPLAGIPFSKLTRRDQCRQALWPNGLPPPLERMFFCGAAVVPDRSYCPEHHARNVTTPRADGRFPSPLAPDDARPLAGGASAQGQRVIFPGGF
jgi:hypothetical protein